MRLAICDEEEMFSEALCSLLSARGHIVRATPSTPNELVSYLRLRPVLDVVILDLQFPDTDGVSTIKLLHDELPVSPIVVLATERTAKRLPSALADGADGIALKTEGINEIERVMKLVSAPAPSQSSKRTNSGKVWSSQARTVVGRHAERPADMQLTQRETEVLRCMVHGDDTATTSRVLGIGQATVRSHLQHLFVKLDVHSRIELIAKAIRLGFVQIDTGSSQTTTSFNHFP